MASFPPVEMICDYLGITKEAIREPHDETIQIPAKLLRLLLELALANQPFDAEHYALVYPDVAKARADGQISDLQSHYTASGYFEGRYLGASELDEEWYRQQYPDLGKALPDSDALRRHFESRGCREWRCPSEAALPLLKRWREVLVE